MEKRKPATTERITQFDGKYRWLSNFWMVDVEFDGIVFPSIEHAYQAAKTKDMSIRRRIAQCGSPGNARKLGRQLELREDWFQIRLRIMEKLLQKKFKDPVLRKRLLDTGKAILVEGNTWDDTFWGVSGGRGENWLGRLIMKVRNQAELANPKPTS